MYLIFVQKINQAVLNGILWFISYKYFGIWPINYDITVDSVS